MMLIIATTDRQRCSPKPEMGKPISIAQALAFARSRKPMAKALPKIVRRKS
jgi:hypothetical protein